MNGNGFVQWIMAGGVVTIAGFSIATYRYVSKIKDEEGQKRARIYERLDEVKKDADEKFTRKDICQLLHTQISTDLSAIKTDVKVLLRENGLEDKK